MLRVIFSTKLKSIKVKYPVEGKKDWRIFQKEEQSILENGRSNRPLFLKTRLRMLPWLAIDHGPTPRRTD